MNHNGCATPNPDAPLLPRFGRGALLTPHFPLDMVGRVRRVSQLPDLVPVHAMRGDRYGNPPSQRKGSEPRS